MMEETWIAPVNIAVVKYWGKRDAARMLPLNDSLSVTAATDALRTTTTVRADARFSADRLWLNGREVLPPSPAYDRFARVVAAARATATVCPAERRTWRVHACSTNRGFPTAAGVASSAAGFACLAAATASLLRSSADVSAIARVGSGSAARSVCGGFVLWNRGGEDSDDDGRDSVARTLFPATHWPELRLVFLVASDAAKAVGSGAGMQASVATSALLAARARDVVPQRVAQVADAVARRDFDAFGTLAMRESNQLHAVCLDTWPPLLYLNATSHAVIRAVLAINAVAGRTLAAYTFDAGPNAVVFVLEKDLPRLCSALVSLFPGIAAARGVADAPCFAHAVAKAAAEPTAADADPALVEAAGFASFPGDFARVLVASVGDGPSKLDASASLLDSEGFPRADDS